MQIVAQIFKWLKYKLNMTEARHKKYKWKRTKKLKYTEY